MDGTILLIIEEIDSPRVMRDMQPPGDDARPAQIRNPPAIARQSSRLAMPAASVDAAQAGAAGCPQALSAA
jgi:hypothetical protein